MGGNIPNLASIGSGYCGIYIAMSKWRRAAKIDANQPEIVRQLRELGCSVETGKDDILVGANGRTYWFEIKEPGAISTVTGQPRPSEIKPSQVKLLDTWKGHYRIAWTLEQILEDIRR